MFGWAITFLVIALIAGLLGFGVVAGRKDDGSGFGRREVLDPFHRHVADGLYKPRAKSHLGHHLAGAASL